MPLQVPLPVLLVQQEEILFMPLTHLLLNGTKKAIATASLVHTIKTTNALLVKLENTKT